MNNIDHIPLLEFNGRTILIQTKENQYRSSMEVIHSPTGNCQLMSIQNIGPHLNNLNKYQIRNLLIQIRRQYYAKRILLIDIKTMFSEHVINSLASSSIINKMDYKSTNGSEMTIILIRLSSIRQFKLPQNGN